MPRHEAMSRGELSEMDRSIKVLIVEDSAFTRKAITRMLESDEEIEVVGATGSGREAIELARELDPDVVTLDIMLPDMDGLSVLSTLMQDFPLPVVIVSALSKQAIVSGLAALELGAIDVVEKPTSLASDEIYHIARRLIASVKAASKLKHMVRAYSVRKPKRSIIRHLGDERKFKVVAIGSSSGGPAALKTLLSSLPDDFPAPILVAQHMPKPFTKHFAERLNRCSKLTTREAEDGDVVEAGKVFIAPGDKHMVVQRSCIAGKVVIRLTDEPSDAICKPSVDALFHSVAYTFGDSSIGVLLSGMGKDGVSGMLAIKRRGGKCIVQDEASCLIFGMPKAAIEAGAVDEVVPIEQMGEYLSSLVCRSA